MQNPKCDLKTVNEKLYSSVSYFETRKIEGMNYDLKDNLINLYNTIKKKNTRVTAKEVKIELL